MANPEHQEIFIIKRHSGHDDAPHGGAWKIAFADFMTAMMALFLVLWLISSTSEKTKHTVAQYFNPVKLVDMTTLKKGFRDPKDTEMGSGPNIKESPDESKSSQRNPAKKTEIDVACKAGPDAPALTEAALFRDPYAVLTEIAASAPAAAQASSSGKPAGAATDPSNSFSDPFTTTPHVPETVRESLLPLLQMSGAQDKESQDKETGTKEAKLNESQSKDINEPHARAPANTPIQKDPADGAPLEKAMDQQGSVQLAETSQVEQSPDAARAAAAAKLKSDIGEAVSHGVHMTNQPHIDVQATADGILISLTDDARFSMFAIGSAEPQPETVQIMEKIGRILKGGTGSIVVRGHTDGRQYKTAAYDNWRLSSARAQMALYMLARGGVSEKRIENIEGYADHHLKSPNNPNASENRRIEVLLRKEKS
ncbi:MotB family protein [Methylocapsa sp. D3K7]|uniref:MotB family protein n=1 Tax=Methylocapsa sp. D3K7 TaxID=3041435 RepID=UPI00244EDCA9|nr:MotB family protein [Methylocapsa sp. D3K7]WGJ14486.1 MotB family protein [Methylocapsa sp. D3K7]